MPIRAILDHGHRFPDSRAEDPVNRGRSVFIDPVKSDEGSSTREDWPHRGDGGLELLPILGEIVPEVRTICDAPGAETFITAEVTPYHRNFPGTRELKELAPARDRPKTYMLVAI